MSTSSSPTREGGKAQSSEATDASTAAATPGFNSKLSAPRERFLASIVEHALLIGRRTAKDFVRTFSPREMMTALTDQPRLRAKLLVATTGLNERIAIKKPAQTAGEDLEIAISEGVTSEDDVVALFDPDDRIRYLDHNKLWGFVIEGEFWRAGAEGVSASVAKEHIAFILERGRAEKLVTEREIIDGISLPVLIESLPKDILGKVIEKSLNEGRAGRVFKDDRVLDVLTPLILAEHISLSQLWVKVVASKLSFWKPGAPAATSSASTAPTPSSSTSASVAASPSPSPSPSPSATTTSGSSPSLPAVTPPPAPVSSSSVGAAAAAAAAVPAESSPVVKPLPPPPPSAHKDEKKADEKKEEPAVAAAKTDEKKADEKKADEKKADTKPDEKKADAKHEEKKADEKKADAKPEEKKADEKKADEKKADAKPEEKKADEKKADGKPEEKKADEKKDASSPASAAPSPTSTLEQRVDAMKTDPPAPPAKDSLLPNDEVDDLLSQVGEAAAGRN